MCKPPKKGSLLAAICFSLGPAVLAGLAVAEMNPFIGWIVGIGVFGLGLDITLRGRNE